MDTTITNIFDRIKTNNDFLKIKVIENVSDIKDFSEMFSNLLLQHNQFDNDTEPSDVVDSLNNIERNAANLLLSIVEQLTNLNISPEHFKTKISKIISEYESKFPLNIGKRTLFIDVYDLKTSEIISRNKFMLESKSGYSCNNCNKQLSDETIIGKSPIVMCESHNWIELHKCCDSFIWLHNGT